MPTASPGIVERDPRRSAGASTLSAASWNSRINPLPRCWSWRARGSSGSRTASFVSMSRPVTIETNFSCRRPRARSTASGFAGDRASGRRSKRSWEHRFFGNSYLVAMDHRTPMTVWSLRASRDVTSFPEQLATLPAGGIVPLMLNELLRTRMPDPVQRAAAVAEFIRSQGLPLVLGEPRHDLQPGSVDSGAGVRVGGHCRRAQCPAVHRLSEQDGSDRRARAVAPTGAGRGREQHADGRQRNLVVQADADGGRWR